MWVYMMKKIVFIITILGFVISLNSCQNDKEMYTISYFDYMYTYIGINLYVTEEEYSIYEQEINTIFETYHQLTTSYDALPENSTFLNNIFSINAQKNQKLPIDKALYEMLLQAINYEELTEGYFDITLGTPVKIWKALIENSPEDLFEGANIFIHSYREEEIKQSGVVEGFDENSISVQLEKDKIIYQRDDLEYELEVSDVQLLNTQQEVDSLNQDKASLVLEEIGQQYFVTFNAKDQALDLGAFSKGYATNIVKDYLIEKQVEYFSISAGSSSISVGKNINRPEQDEIFIVSLTDPMFSTSVFNKYYGLIHIKDTSVATSGNFEQYTLYEGIRYHHIISPFTYYPVNEYYALTITGNDAGLLDALSTALYVMDIETLTTFMENHQETLGIQLIAYVQDGSILRFTEDLYFEDKRS